MSNQLPSGRSPGVHPRTKSTSASADRDAAQKSSAKRECARAGSRTGEGGRVRVNGALAESAHKWRMATKSVRSARKSGREPPGLPCAQQAVVHHLHDRAPRRGEHIDSRPVQASSDCRLERIPRPHLLTAMTTSSRDPAFETITKRNTSHGGSSVRRGFPRGNAAGVESGNLTNPGTRR